MYNITSETPEVLGTPRMKTGIRQNVRFDGARMETKNFNDQEQDVLIYSFSDASGTLEYIMFEVNEDDVRSAPWVGEPVQYANKRFGLNAGDIMTEEIAVAMAGDTFARMNKHILNRFVDEQQLIEATKDVSSYSEFAEAVIGLLLSVEKVPMVRLYVILNKKDFPTLPSNPPFIELMSVPEEQSKLSINPKHKLAPNESVAQATTDPTQLSPAGLDGYTDSHTGF